LSEVQRDLPPEIATAPAPAPRPEVPKKRARINAMRFFLNQFDYEGKDPSVVYPADPLLVHRGRCSCTAAGTGGRSDLAVCVGNRHVHLRSHHLSGAAGGGGASGGRANSPPSCLAVGPCFGRPAARPAAPRRHEIGLLAASSRWPKCAVKERHHLPTDLQIRHISVEVDPVQAPQIERDLPVENLIDRYRCGHDRQPGPPTHALTSGSVSRRRAIGGDSVGPPPRHRPPATISSIPTTQLGGPRLASLDDRFLGRGGSRPPTGTVARERGRQPGRD
jgi:hypothetical protein